MTTIMNIDQSTLAKNIAHVPHQKWVKKWLRIGSLLGSAIAFQLLIFAIPILLLLTQSVYVPDAASVFVKTAIALSDSPSPETRFDALTEDLRARGDGRSLARAAKIVNEVQPGFQTMVTRAGRAARGTDARFGAPEYLQLDARWGDADIWRAIEDASRPFTLRYVLATLDLRWTDKGIEQMPAERRVFRSYLSRTLWISLVCTALCLIIALPIAFVLSSAKGLAKTILRLLILLPFWTSILVRTTAWVILLQKGGLINDLLLAVNIVGEPVELIYNRVGVYVAMVHILLPFMILPIANAMEAVPPNLMRAAASLGARPVSAFISVYVPQILPGIVAGCVLVWAFALGFYITPALIGGGGDQMLSSLIADFALKTGNWPMASATALLLLAAIGATFAGIAGIRVACSKMTRFG